MGIQDKVTGKAKQVVGDLKDDTDCGRRARTRSARARRRKSSTTPRIAPTRRPPRSRTSSARPESRGQQPRLEGLGRSGRALLFAVTPYAARTASTFSRDIAYS